MAGNKQSDIKHGALVKVVQKHDQRTGKLTEGTVKDILTKSAFHPHGSQQVLQLNEGVFTLLRTSPDWKHRVLCAHNLSDRVESLHICTAELNLPAGKWRDLVSGREYNLEQESTISLEPYAVLWLKL